MKMKKIGIFALCACMVGFAVADTTFLGGNMFTAGNWDNGIPNGTGDTNGIVNVDGTIPAVSQADATFSGSTITVGSNAVITAGTATSGDLPAGNTDWIFNDCTVNLGDDLFDNGSVITLNAGSAVTTTDDFEVQGSAAGGGFIINGGSHTAGDYFGNQGGNRSSYIQFSGGTVTAARFRFKANSTGTSYTEISGSATAVATGTTVSSDVGGDVDIQTPWTGSLKAANFSGSDWQNVVTGFWTLDGFPVDAVSFGNNFAVTDGGTTLMHIDTPNKLPQFIADPVTTANGTYGTEYVGETLENSATNVAGDTMSYEKVGGPDWLEVAVDGDLSGTPTATGTNLFTIRAYTGDFSSLGTLKIEVDQLGDSPVFTNDVIYRVNAVFGEDYDLQSQSLTNSATDLDGNTLSYFKDGGPGWLNIASNGALSGVCNILGTNSFPISVDDGNGNSDTATLVIFAPVIGDPPVFTTNVIEKANGALDADYASKGQTLAGSATDPNSGDTLTYTKAGGPAWLVIATNGALSGVCNVLGTNSFPVEVDDGNGNTDTATLLIYVEPAPLGDLIVGWDTFSGTGATAPVDATFTSNNITGSFVSTTEGEAWGRTDERGASADGTWGTHPGPPTASVVTNADFENLHLPNGTTGGTLTFSITNNATEDIELGRFHFDAYAFRPNAARTYELSVLAGSGISTGVVFTSANDAITSVGGAWNNLAHDDIDISLAGLADNVLGAGESVQFLLAFSSGTGGGGGHHLFVDNFGISLAADGGAPSEQPVMSTEVSGGEMTITWTGDGFVLQTCPSLPIADWKDVPGAGANSATVQMTNAVEFLRLLWSE